ncbi:hypothetical protein [Bradyrhizobium diazoefficiens]|uniref:DUF1214 domain-containing protein n=1 Tax=Bradyrhizobium diazoefficiens TaxID=1355477 RepID=A0A810BPZ1_9BRAD|nr:hypothetical protein XF8B_76110 [Bradyrhizobium diazoefficiens]
MTKIVFLATAALAWAGPALANAFDDCVLNKMAGVTSDAAAKAIKEACLRKNSVVIDEGDLRGLRIVGGGYGRYGISNTAGFTAEVKNDTGYIVTEITFGIVIADGQPEYFRVDNFLYQEPGVIYTGLPPDPTVSMRIDPGRSHKFQFSVDRPEIDKKKKWNWFIAGAKGIVTR